MIEERPERLNSTTYKIKPPVIDDAIYITITNMVIKDEERPLEVFINCKHMKSFEWISLVTRLTSLIFKEDEFNRKALDELIETHDPKGGYIIPKSNNKKVHGIASHIGEIIKEHCVGLGLIEE